MPETFDLEVELPRSRQTIRIAAERADERLTDVLRRAGIALNTRCGQRGLCDGCIVERVSGRLTPLSGAATVASGDGANRVRACQCRLAPGEPVRIRVPARSLLEQGPHVVSQFTIRVPRAHSPLGQTVKLPRHRSAGDGDPTDVICRELAARLPPGSVVHCPTEAETPILECVRDFDAYVSVEYHGTEWRATGVYSAPVGPRIGAAVDVGTTTVALLLVDLDTGEILAESADFNQQIQFGDDVVTRIGLCAADPTMVTRLQAAVVRATLRPLLENALKKAGRTFDDVACLTVAGNSTMLHLLGGVDPAPMGTVPFTPAFLHHRVIRSDALTGMSRSESTVGRLQHEESGAAGSTRAAACRWASRTGPAVHLLPGAAAYVGADICAGVFASGLAYEDGPSLLVDVGTNGEIVLNHNGQLHGCATAAGPAFEGCGLTSGVRAGAGAIGHMHFTSDPLTVHTEVIGGGPPTGICGSAYVDFLAEARRSRLINRVGRFERNAWPAGAERLISRDDDGLALRVANGAGGQRIVVTESDIARLLQAKAAIAAGILTLLGRLGISPTDIRTLYLAGGFGLHVRPESAVGCGLLPGFRPDQVALLGNSALAGAYLALLDSGAVEELARIGRRIEIVELNLERGFEGCYIRQLRLPP